MSSKKSSQKSPKKSSVSEKATDVSIRLLHEDIQKLLKGVHELQKKQLEIEQQIRELQSKKVLPQPGGWDPYTQPYTTTWASTTDGAELTLTYDNVADNIEKTAYIYTGLSKAYEAIGSLYKNASRYQERLGTKKEKKA